jgi:hypothetical protein
MPPRGEPKQETSEDAGMGKVFVIALALGVATLIGVAVFVIQL